jgi:hypothetical protein
MVSHLHVRLALYLLNNTFSYYMVLTCLNISKILKLISFGNKGYKDDSLSQILSITRTATSFS